MEWIDIDTLLKILDKIGWLPVVIMAFLLFPMMLAGFFVWRMDKSLLLLKASMDALRSDIVMLRMGLRWMEEIDQQVREGDENASVKQQRRYRKGGP